MSHVTVPGAHGRPHTFFQVVRELEEELEETIEHCIASCLPGQHGSPLPDMRIRGDAHVGDERPCPTIGGSHGG